MWNYLKKIGVGILALVILIGNPLTSIAANSLATLGDTTNGAGALGTTVDGIRVSPATATETGVLITGESRIWLNSAGSTGVKMVIFSDSAGDPDALLATSDEVIITNTTEDGIDFTFSGANQIAITNGVTYWVGFAFDAGGGVQVNRSNIASGGSTRHSSDAYGDGVEATFTQSSSDTGLLNSYVTFNVNQGQNCGFLITNLCFNYSGLRYVFDGVDERLVSASNPSFSTDTKTGGRDICLRTRLDTLPASEALKTLLAWSGSDGQGVWNFRIRTDRAAFPWTGTRLEFQTAPDTGAGTGSSTLWYSSNQTFAVDTNYLICVGSTATAWQLHVNGVAKTVTVTNTGTGGDDGDWWGDVAGSGTITFSFFGSASTSVDGFGDTIMYFDDNLTDAEHTLLWNNGKPTHPRALGLTDLSGYWKLGEDDNGVVTTTFDAEGDDNLTPTNMEDADIVRTNYY